MPEERRAYRDEKILEKKEVMRKIERKNRTLRLCLKTDYHISALNEFVKRAEGKMAPSKRSNAVKCL